MNHLYIGVAAVALALTPAANAQSDRLADVADSVVANRRAVSGFSVNGHDFHVKVPQVRFSGREGERVAIVSGEISHRLSLRPDDQYRYSFTVTMAGDLTEVSEQINRGGLSSLLSRAARIPGSSLAPNVLRRPERAVESIGGAVGRGVDGGWEGSARRIVVAIAAGVARNMQPRRRDMRDNDGAVENRRSSAAGGARTAQPATRDTRAGGNAAANRRSSSASPRAKQGRRTTNVATASNRPVQGDSTALSGVGTATGGAVPLGRDDLPNEWARPPQASGVLLTGSAWLAPGDTLDLDRRAKYAVTELVSDVRLDALHRLVPLADAALLPGDGARQGYFGCLAAAGAAADPVEIDPALEDSFQCVQTNGGRIAELRFQAIEGGNVGVAGNASPRPENAIVRVSYTVWNSE